MAPKASAAPAQQPSLTGGAQPLLTGGAQAQYGATFDAIDTNNDGVIDAGEWEAAPESAREKMQGFWKGMTAGAEEMDAKLPKKVVHFFNTWIAETHQFDEMEDTAGGLICARVLRMFLMFFICTSLMGLCVGFFLKGSTTAPMETEQSGKIAAPSVVFCGSPWGTDFLNFGVEGADQGLFPGRAWQGIPDKNFSISRFDSSLGFERAAAYTGCMLVKLNDVQLKSRGKVAQYDAFESIRLTINAQTEDGNFNFGFCNDDNMLPQRWSYGSLGNRITGEISYDQVNVGATDVSEGTPRSILDFKVSGTSSSGRKTQIEYYFGYFMIRVLSAQAKGISLFSYVAFVLLIAAALSTLELFDLVFMEVVPDDEPPPSLEPNMLCQVVCGKFLPACRRRKKVPEEAAEEAA